MGDESGAGVADGLSSGRPDAELRLGKPDRDHRKRQVRGYNRRLLKPARGPRRNGTSQVCDERRAGRTKRAGPALVAPDMAGYQFGEVIVDVHVPYHSVKSVLLNREEHS